MYEMFPCGLFQPPGSKVFGVLNDGIAYGDDVIPYDEIDSITLMTAPTPLTNGVANMAVHGQSLALVYKFSDRERAAMALNFAQEKVDLAHGVVKDYIYRIAAHTGTTLEVYDSYIIINFMRTGATLANIFSGGGTGGKRINFYDISAIQFKEPGGVSVGFIQFSYPGSVDVQGSVVDAINNENSIPVSPENLAVAREVVDFIEKRRSELRTQGSGTTVTNINQISAADELKKFKELLDMGVITQDEFDVKKAELLSSNGGSRTSVTDPRIEAERQRKEAEARRLEANRRAEEERRFDAQRRAEQERQAEEDRRIEEAIQRQRRLDAEHQEKEARRLEAEKRAAEERAAEEKRKAEEAERIRIQMEKEAAEEAARKAEIAAKNEKSAKIMKSMLLTTLIIFASTFLMNLIVSISLAGNIGMDIGVFIFATFFIAAIPFLFTYLAIKSSYGINGIKKGLKFLANILSLIEAVIFTIVTIVMFTQASYTMGVIFTCVSAIAISNIVYLKKTKSIG